MNSSQRNVLLIANDEHLVLSFLYCLRKEPGYRYYLLTHKAKSSAGWSRYLKDVHFYKEYSELESVIPECLRKWDIDVLMPIGEKESLEVSRNRETLEKLCKVMPLTDPAHFEIATNKKALNQFLLKQELPLMSATLDLDAPNFLSRLEAFPFPALLKPAQGAFGSGIVTIHTKADLESYLLKNEVDKQGFYLQEYVEGSDINFNVICKDGDILHYSYQESPPKQLGNYNKNDDLIFKDDPEVVAIMKPMLKALNYQGVACIDLRRSTTGKVYLLEINARYWGSMMASLTKAGVNFPLLMLKLTVDEIAPSYQRKEGSQLSLQSFVKQFLRFKWPELKQLKYWPYLNDPMARIMVYWYQKFK